MNKESNRLLYMILGVAAIAAGIVLIFVMAGKTSRMLKRCTKETTAKVLSVKRKHDSDGDTEYRTTILFSIEGKEYRETKDLKVSRRNDELIVKYNPDKPEEYFVEGFSDSPAKLRLIGLIFIALGALVIFGPMIRNRT